MWENLWNFSTRNFRVTLSCAPEPDPDVSWMDEHELAALERGDLDNLVFRVQVFYRGTLFGEDYLGNSVYDDPRKFRTEHMASTSGGYFTDMVKEAIRQTRGMFADIRETPLRA